MLKPYDHYHETRLPFDQRREILWKTLCDAYFRKLIKPDDCVVELGAGYGHFINHVSCARRIAIDRWEGMLPYLDPAVTGIIGSVTDIGGVDDHSVDFILASNLIEHLRQDEFAVMLQAARCKLKDAGTLNILQPNYRFAYREYFDDFTHVSIYSDRSMCDFLGANGFRVIECLPRFLPLTIKSRFPVWPAAIRLYLRLPYKPLAKQMLIRAVPQ